MGGGLLQLSSYGSENQYLHGNPQITFFKVVYKRHTNFAMESIDAIFDGSSQLSPDKPITLKLKIPRNGDLISALFLRVQLPDIYSTSAEEFFWTRGIGLAMINYVDIFIGGSKIQRLTGQYLDIYSQLYHPEGKRHRFQQMVGDDYSISSNRTHGVNNSNEDKSYYGYHSKEYGDNTVDNKYHNSRPSLFGRELTIPLNFWFMEHKGCALPLIALQYHDVDIEIELKAIKDLYTVLVDDPTGDSRIIDSGLQQGYTKEAIPITNIKTDTYYRILDIQSFNNNNMFWSMFTDDLDAPSRGINPNRGANDITYSNTSYTIGDVFKSKKTYNTDGDKLVSYVNGESTLLNSTDKVYRVDLLEKSLIDVIVKQGYIIQNGIKPQDSVVWRLARNINISDQSIYIYGTGSTPEIDPTIDIIIAIPNASPLGTSSRASAIYSSTIEYVMEVGSDGLTGRERSVQTNNVHHLTKYRVKGDGYIGKYLFPTQSPSNTNTETWDLLPHLDITYIFLDDSERRVFAQNTHEYLMTQINYNTLENVHGSVIMELEPFHPCKEMIFTVNKNDNYIRNEWLNYSQHDIRPYSQSHTEIFDYNDHWWHSSTNFIGTEFMKPDGTPGTHTTSKYGSDNLVYFDREYTLADFIKFRHIWPFRQLDSIPKITKDKIHLYNINCMNSLEIKFNGYTRQNNRSSTYYNTIQSYLHHTSNTEQPIYIYSFALNPEEYQPSGACNFSKIKNVSCNFELNIPDDIVNNGVVSKEWEYNISAYIITYNIVKIASGMGGLTFAN